MEKDFLIRHINPVDKSKDKKILINESIILLAIILSNCHFDKLKQSLFDLDFEFLTLDVFLGINRIVVSQINIPTPVDLYEVSRLQD